MVINNNKVTLNPTVRNISLLNNESTVKIRIKKKGKKIKTGLVSAAKQPNKTDKRIL